MDEPAPNKPDTWRKEKKESKDPKKGSPKPSPLKKPLILLGIMAVLLAGGIVFLIV